MSSELMPRLPHWCHHAGLSIVALTAHDLGGSFLPPQSLSSLFPSSGKPPVKESGDATARQREERCYAFNPAIFRLKLGHDERYKRKTWPVCPTFAIQELFLLLL